MEERMRSLVERRLFFVPIVNILVAILLVVAAVASHTVLADKYSSVEAYAHEMEQLDKRKLTSGSMSVAAVTASAFITTIPDDVGTPIANELAEIGKGMGFVTGAIILEKYSMTVLGYGLFGVVLPLALLVFAASLALPIAPDLKRMGCLGIGRVLLAIALLWYSVPLSVRISDMVFETYEATLNEAIDRANYAEQMSKENSEQKQGTKSDEPKEFNLSVEGVMAAIGDAASGVADTVGSAVDSATNKVAVAVEWAKVVLTGLTEGFAVMVVITIFVPILVPAAMIWTVNLLFQPSGVAMPVLTPATPMRMFGFGRKGSPAAALAEREKDSEQAG